MSQNQGDKDKNKRDLLSPYVAAPTLSGHEGETGVSRAHCNPGEVLGTPLHHLFLSLNLLQLLMRLLAKPGGVKAIQRASQSSTPVLQEQLSCCQTDQEGAAGSHFTAFHLELFQYLYLFLHFLSAFLFMEKKNEKRKKKKRRDKREQLLSSIKFEGIKGNSS